MKPISDPKVDALHIVFSETMAATEEPAESIAADYDSQERLAGIEILDAVLRFGRRECLRQVTAEGTGQARAA